MEDIIASGTVTGTGHRLYRSASYVLHLIFLEYMHIMCMTSRLRDLRSLRIYLSFHVNAVSCYLGPAMHLSHDAGVTASQCREVSDI